MPELRDSDLEEIRNIEKEVQNAIPAGYIQIELSTHGHLGAPKKFHICNFQSEDLVGLALTEDDDIQLKVIEMLQSLIWEKNVDIRAFHEKEVVETMIILLKNYYQSELKDCEWEVSEEDKKQIALESGGENTELYMQKMQALENKTWVPRFNINLNDIQYYELNDDFMSDILVEKANGFSCVYSYPRYGDICILKKCLLELPEFKKGEQRFASIRSNLKYRERMIERREKGDLSIDIKQLPYYPENEIKEFREYDTRKAQWATKAIKALHLKEINGQSVYNLPLYERMKIAENKELDHSTFESVSKAYEALKIGPIEDFDAFDPILRKVVKTHYSFRLFTLLQAIQHSKPNGTTIKFVKGNK